MTPDLRTLLYSCFLAWVMLLTGSFVRSRLWTLQGWRVGLGNRDDLPPATPLSGRADRAAVNMLENLVLFAVVLVTARLAGVPGARLELGASLFFWARVAYFAIYLAGVPYLRTAVWAVAVGGTFLVAAEALMYVPTP